MTFVGQNMHARFLFDRRIDIGALGFEISTELNGVPNCSVEKSRCCRAICRMIFLQFLD